MPPLKYHEGQLSIQREAKTEAVAEHLAHWVGPATAFALDADLFLFAQPDSLGVLRFTTLSGPAPLLAIGPGDDVNIQFLPELADQLPVGRCGGLAISLALARRARLNGAMVRREGLAVLQSDETFTLCRKYMAPSVSLADAPAVGPVARVSVALDDPWLRSLLSRAETAFLASLSPDGGPDVAHRGGPPGFIELEPGGALHWPEYVGDGVFKSAGNVRATGHFTLLVVDAESGDGAELVGKAGYTNTRPERRARVDALVQHRDPFPQQGVIEGTVVEASRLERVIHTRRRVDRTLRVTSASSVGEQAPQ